MPCTVKELRHGEKVVGWVPLPDAKILYSLVFYIPRVHAIGTTSSLRVVDINNSVFLL